MADKATRTTVWLICAFVAGFAYCASLTAFGWIIARTP
jgi:hypothetical protein